MEINNIALVVIILVLPTGIISWFFVSTVKAFNKFDALDASVKNKLLLIEYYMAFIRQLKRDELIMIGELPDGEIKNLNKVYDTRERIQIARRAISGNRYNNG